VQTTNPVGQRRNNLAVLARAIWKNPGISRRELLGSFDIDESSVSRLVKLLISIGLVHSVGTVEGSAIQGAAPGGRRRIALRIRSDFGQAWGLTLWRDRVRVTIVDSTGVSLASTEFPLGPYDGNWKAYLDRAIVYAIDLAGTLPTVMPLLGIGFAVPGWVDSETSTIVSSDEFGLVHEVCVRQQNSTFPVLWENDANCGAWSGLGRNGPAVDDLFVLGRFLENGPMGFQSEFSIGFGFVIAGQLHRGWRHKTGEFLSALWHPGIKSAFGVDDETFGHTQSNPRAYLDTLTDLMRNLRFASLFLDPRNIHLGGDLKNRFDFVLEACARIGWTDAADQLHPLPPKVDEVSLGAALLVLDELFQLPSANRRTLFRGYGTGTDDPLWRGIPFPEVQKKGPLILG